jgi:hypothetical protein
MWMNHNILWFNKHNARNVYPRTRQRNMKRWEKEYAWTEQKKIVLEMKENYVNVIENNKFNFFRLPRRKIFVFLFLLCFWFCYFIFILFFWESLDNDHHGGDDEICLCWIQKGWLKILHDEMSYRRIFGMWWSDA